MTKLAEILPQIKLRPAMYFRRGRSFDQLEAFIIGYQIGRESGDAHTFDDFFFWVSTHYRVRRGAMNGFSIILDHVGGNDSVAFEEFFRLWPDYARDLEQFGSKGIRERFEITMTELGSRPGV